MMQQTQQLGARAGTGRLASTSAAASALAPPARAPRHHRRHRQTPLVAAAAATTATTAEEQQQQQQQLTPPNPLLVGLVERLFALPPVFDAATRKARGMIISRAGAIGLSWDATLERLQGAADWDAAVEAATDPQALPYPSYYTKPFHAYRDGNLCLQAAQEFFLSSRSVHAPVMDPSNKVMDPDGDDRLRKSYGRCMLELMQQLREEEGGSSDGGVPEPGAVRAVLDVGCATGLSSLALAELFPNAHVTAVDLSPHMVAVGRFMQQEREREAGAPERLTLLHRNAERTGLPAGSFDAVSVCLVAHELPQAATRAVLAEAQRLLRPGGVVAIMEMDPSAAAFRRVFSNPFAYTAFKSTEPWLLEYVSLDLHGALRGAGFGRALQASNSPRHRTVVARKPLLH